MKKINKLRDARWGSCTAYWHTKIKRNDDSSIIYMVEWVLVVLGLGSDQSPKSLNPRDLSSMEFRKIL